MVPQPGARLLGVLLEPSRSAAEPKTVAPGIHIGEQALRPHPRQLLRHQHLQHADRILLGDIATGIGMQRCAPRAIHADEMRGLVQRRMHRRIVAQIDEGADQAGLGRAPKGARNRRARLDPQRL